DERGRVMAGGRRGDRASPPLHGASIRLVPDVEDAPVTGSPPRMARAVAALLGALALAAMGCRRFQPAPLSPADSASALESRSLADPELRALFERVLPGGAPRWPIEKWDLGTLTVAALYYHPSLEVARAQWRVAEAGIATAGARPNPTLSITPQYV